LKNDSNKKDVKKLLFIFGTRPEAIKLAPLIKKIEGDSKFSFSLCVTGQHKEMLKQVLSFFNIIPDYDLKVMEPDQNLFSITSKILLGLQKIIDKEKPDLIIVQGDTTTAFIGALAGFYKKIKVAHVEAGLRSGVTYSPFPEEVNRKLVGHIADYHFAPTSHALYNLKKEGIVDNIFQVGNSVIDALLLGLDLVKKNNKKYKLFFNFLNNEKRTILVTSHRRESFGKPFEEICNAIKDIATSDKNVEIVYPLHLNPNVRKPVMRILDNIDNIHLIEPLSYSHLIWIMDKSYLVLTDSGGIQEEAPSLGKPVLVMRDVTERVEGVKAGTAKLVGTNRKLIVGSTLRLLSDSKYYTSMSNVVNPYGDGKTSERIVKILNERLD